MSVRAFYDELAPLYHLIFENWEASVAWQGTAVASLIAEHWGAGARTVLDASVGIGTQALGLLARGFRVTGSDLSRAAVERARREAAGRHLSLPCVVADFRALPLSEASVDVVIVCDNALPRRRARSRQHSANASAAFGRVVVACSRCVTMDYRRLPGRSRCGRTASALGLGGAITYNRSGAGAGRDMTCRSRSWV
jgi:hypothetical protein